MRTRIWLLTTILATFLLISAPAGAALVDEQHQGQKLIAQLNASTTTCTALSADDFDHIGEYVMFKALGSTTLHRAMNDRMTQMMGGQGETRMHQLLGARYAGCTTTGLGTPGFGAMMGGAGMIGGGGVMGGYYNGGGWGAMMSSSDWSWMASGTWQHMTRQDWRQLQQRLLGTSTMNHHSRWGALPVIGATLAAAVLVLVAILAILEITRRRPGQRPSDTAPSA